MGKNIATGPGEYDRRLWSKVYAYLLAELDSFGLDPADKQNLLDRGLTEADIRRNSYRSLGPDRNPVVAQRVFNEFRGRIWDVPGIVRRPDGKPDLAVSKGLLIPMKDHDGWIKAAQVRTNLKGSKYVWFTQGGRSAGQPVHFSRRPVVNDLWAVTEGPLKADVAQALWPGEDGPERPTFVAPGGVGGWQAVVRALDNRDVPRPAGVIIALDQDGQAGTKNAALGLLDACKQRRLDVFSAAWAGDCKGVDDALYNGTEVAIEEVA